MIVRPSITLVIVYYGKFPAFFKYWLRSCQNNGDIKWIIITDNSVDHCPQNVKIVNMSFDSLKTLFEDKLGFEIGLNSPYKLCDFKPAYGDLLSEVIGDCDFWGHCDMDLIFGNIRKFVTEEILGKYDRVFVRGHLSIFRNNHNVNSLYKTLSDEECHFEKIFKSKLNWAFDEFGGKTNTGGINRLFDDNAVKQFKDILFDDIRQNQKSFYSLRPLYGRNSLDGVKYMNSYYKYSHGNLFRYILNEGEWEQSESLYIHFQNRKMTFNADDLDNYLIIPNSFENIDKDVDLKKITNYTFFYPHYTKVRLKNLRKKIKNFIYDIK